MHLYYNTANSFFKNKFGHKIIKIPLDGGFTCPNRDGKLSTKGCIFCSENGSGSIFLNRKYDINQQFQYAKSIMSNKWKDGKYMVYFQSFTNTYAEISYLENLFTSASLLPDVVAISIATRPDCIDEEIVQFLHTLNKKIYVCIELGFQTSNTKSIDLINRCYPNSVFEESMKILNKYQIDVICHTIFGLPYETKEDMLSTINYLNNYNISGIKLQLLHIIRNTPLHQLYIKNPFHILSLDEYVDIIISAIEILPPDIVIHRLTGDGDKSTLIEPIWSLNKKLVMNSINKEFSIRSTFQAKKYAKNLQL